MDFRMRQLGSCLKTPEWIGLSALGCFEIHILGLRPRLV
jgi:hypothetical protein